MKKKLSRSYARLILILFGIIMLGGLVLAIFGSRLPFPINIALACIIVVLLPIGVILRFSKLRCTYCGKSAAVPQWYKDSEARYCTTCGKQFIYDDQELEESRKE